MRTPLVSICIPTYNGESFLRECLDSCIDQSFDDYEIVICDDRSEDGTWHLLESYVNDNSKIRLFKNESNLGLVGNWNRCIENARGEWIKFVFQDDFVRRDCLEKFVNEIEPGIELIVCARNFVLSKNAPLEQLKYYNEGVRTLKNTCSQNSNTYSPEVIAGIAISNMAMNFIAEPSLTFFRKSVVNRVGVFNPHLKQICDLEFFLRLASQCGLRYVPEKLCGFRIHEASTTSTNVENKYYDLRYIETLLFSYFLLFDPQFEVFRTNLNFFQKIKLQIYFRVKAYNAYKVGLAQSKNHPVFQANSPFPVIYSVRKGNVFIRLIALIKR
ncbi:MAG: glycosyltransferase family 2 protein [Bacteroidia bacterium]|nr:glycosyltransferase family 2 protein [Bacteroidia bacterium]